MNTTRHDRGRAIGARAAAALHALLLSSLLAAGPVMAAKSISATGSMAFGRFVPASGGNITISSAGARSRTGGVVLLPSSATAASFSIGENGPSNDNRIYILTLPANGTVTLASGPLRMPVNNFVSSNPGSGPLAPGTQTLTVGATLQVAPGQRPGNYSGSFHVTLEFQ